MKQRLCLLLLLLLSGIAAAGDAPCSSQSEIGQSCWLPMLELHPTQSAIGELQVQASVSKLLKKPDIAAWQARKPLPVAIGPDGQFYLLDGHHAARAFWVAGLKRLRVSITGKLTNPADFWQQMQARNWAYLRDTHGRPITPTDLPANIAALRDDPYRALAGLARERGYYRKTDAFFIEFEWARYLGKALNWQAIDNTNLATLLNKARFLACAPEARELPGYDAATCQAASSPAQ